MADAKETKVSVPTASGNRKKISVKQVKLSDMDVGYTFRGKFLQFTKGSPFTEIKKDTGEIVTKELQFALLESDTGERISYVADKGLIDGFNMAGVTQGMKIEVEKLDKVKIGKGREMNQYEIYTI